MNSKKLAMRIMGGVLLIAVLGGCSSPTPTLAPVVNTQSTLNDIKTQSVSTAIADMTKNAPAATLSVAQTPVTNQYLGCTVIDVSPAMNTSYAPNTDFDVNWVIKNTGGGIWQHNSVDVRYSSGDKLQKSASVYDIKNDVASGASFTTLVNMRAPASAGTYTTNWVVNSGQQVFCKMTLTIIVN